MRKEIQIALLAIVVAVLAIWGFKFLSGQNLFGQAKTFYTTVNNAKEINTATKVLINGYSSKLHYSGTQKRRTNGWQGTRIDI